MDLGDFYEVDMKLCEVGTGVLCVRVMGVYNGR